MLQKHFVDRYNIFFAYAPSRINKNIHTSAINFVMIALLILQLSLFFFSLLRHGLKGVTIFALCGFCATLFFVFAQATFRWFRSLAPISYRVGHGQEQPEKNAFRQDDACLPIPVQAGDMVLVESNDSFLLHASAVRFFHFCMLTLANLAVFHSGCGH
jgi:hypothetical protein